MGGGGVVVYDGVIRAAGAAFAPGRRCGCLLRSLLSLSRYAALRGYPCPCQFPTVNMGDDPVARCKRSAPAKHPVRDADEAAEI